MKKLLLAFMLGIMLFSFIGFACAEDLVYLQGQEIDLKIPCFDDGAYCDSTYSCNLTIYQQNNITALVNNQQMQRRNSYYNYTLGTLYKVNNYHGSMSCSNGTYSGKTDVDFKVTPSGMNDINDGAGTSLAVAVIVMLVVSIFLFIISFKFQNLAGKIIFIGLAAIVLMMAILFSLVSVQQIFGGFDAIIEGYTTFWFVMKIIIGIAVTSLIIFALFISYRIWKFKRGFID